MIVSTSVAVKPVVENATSAAVVTPVSTRFKLSLRLVCNAAVLFTVCAVPVAVKRIVEPVVTPSKVKAVSPAVEMSVKPPKRATLTVLVPPPVTTNFSKPVTVVVNAVPSAAVEEAVAALAEVMDNVSPVPAPAAIEPPEPTAAAVKVTVSLPSPVVMAFVVAPTVIVSAPAPPV